MASLFWDSHFPCCKLGLTANNGGTWTAGTFDELVLESCVQHFYHCSNYWKQYHHEHEPCLHPSCRTGMLNTVEFNLFKVMQLANGSFILLWRQMSKCTNEHCKMMAGCDLCCTGGKECAGDSCVLLWLGVKRSSTEVTAKLMMQDIRRLHFYLK